MIDETTGADAPEVESNELSATDENALAASTGEQSDDNGEADQTDGTGDDEAAKVPDGVQKRINEITRKKHEAERRADQAERKLKQLEKVNIDDLDYDDQIAERTLQRSKREQALDERETASDLAREAYNARIETIATKYPDFQTVAHGDHWNPTPVMVEVIMDSDLGPQVAYHLGKNPAEAARIAALNPISQVREMGKIEAAIAAPKQQRDPPPAPIKKVGGTTSGGHKDPSKMTMSEYVAWRGSK